jgi:hypothetical protein
MKTFRFWFEDGASCHYTGYRVGEAIMALIQDGLHDMYKVTKIEEVK